MFAEATLATIGLLIVLVATGSLIGVWAGTKLSRWK
jgi:hypothetical protein